MKKIGFTYIVPTILKFEGFEEQIANIAKSNYINDVVIINNSGKKYIPTELGERLYDCRYKIMVINPRQGLYCNGAWNVGVKYANRESNYVILATEDIIFNHNVIDLIAEQIEDLPKLGVLGMDWTLMSEENYKHIDYVYIEEGTTQREYGFGLMMFLEKNKYIQIPEELKHWYGDDFLYYSLLEKGYKNYLLKSDTFRIKTVAGSMSTSDTTKLRIAADKGNWINKYYNKFSKYGTRCG